MSVRPKQSRARGMRLKFQRGSMMIEVLVSVVLLSVSVLGLVRVLGQSMKDSGELEYRSVAATLADQTIGTMWVTNPANLTTYATTNTGNITDLPSGTRTVTYNATTKVITVTIGWQAPGATASQYQISATLSRN